MTTYGLSIFLHLVLYMKRCPKLLIERADFLIRKVRDECKELLLPYGLIEQSCTPSRIGMFDSP